MAHGAGYKTFFSLTLCLPVVKIVPYNRPALCLVPCRLHLFNGEKQVQLPLDNESVRDDHE
jgi:hypothetical protein